MIKKIIKFMFILLSLIIFTSCDIVGMTPQQPDENKKEVNVKIARLPNKTSYYENEELDFSGLVVKLYYDDESSIVINDYEIIYDNLVLGNNEITIKYKDFYDLFNIQINKKEEMPTKKILNEHLNYQEKTTINVNCQDYSYILNDVYYGVIRKADMMIAYDEARFVHTNIYGYEAAIDKYGMVVEIAKNVSLPDGGMVISAHGSRIEEIQNLQIGDVILYLNNKAYVYRKENISLANSLFVKFYEVLDSLDDTNLLVYNEQIDLLNSVIPYLDSLYNTYDKEKYQSAIVILNSFESDVYEHQHQYSYVNEIFDEYPLEERTINYELYSFYSEKIRIGGFRTDDLIFYYDKASYRERNDFGYEVSVDKNGIVVKKDVLVSLEEDGFILSGASAAATFLIENVEVGDLIKIVDNKVHVYRDIINTYYQKYGKLRNKLVTIVNNDLEKAIPHDYQFIEQIIKKIDECLDSFNKNDLTLANYIEITQNVKLINEYIALGYAQLIEYEAEETKGINYSPFTKPLIYDDTTIDGVRKTLSDFKEMGINEITIYTFFEDYSLFDNSVYHIHPVVSKYSYGEYGNDYLKCFIEEAHKLNIAVSAFTQNFREYIGTMKNPKEEYYQIDYNGDKTKGSIYYYDICNDELQDIIITWYKELLTKYDFDKIEYDIIRYPISYLYKYDTIEEISTTSNIIDPGYTVYSMNKFMNQYNLTGDLKELIRTSRDIRRKWLDFKEESLINYITKCSTELRAINPNIIITAAVLNDSSMADIAYLQDYKKWLEMGIIDIAEVMMYSISNNHIEEMILDVQDIINKGQAIMYISPRLDSYNIIIDLQQIRLASIRNGFYLFSSSLYNDQVFERILKSNHHGEMVSIYNSEEEIEKAKINEVIDMIDYYYSKRNNEDYKDLIYALENNSDYISIINNLNDSKMKEYLLNILKK